MRTHVRLLLVLLSAPVLLCPAELALAQNTTLITSHPYRPTDGMVMCDVYREDGGAHVLVGLDYDVPTIYRMVPKPGAHDEFSVMNLPIDSTLLAVTVGPGGIQVASSEVMRLEIIDATTKRVVASHDLADANERSISIAALAAGTYQLLAWNEKRASLYDMNVPRGAFPH